MFICFICFIWIKPLRVKISQHSRLKLQLPTFLDLYKQHPAKTATTISVSRSFASTIFLLAFSSGASISICFDFASRPLACHIFISDPSFPISLLTFHRHFIHKNSFGECETNNNKTPATASITATQIRINDNWNVHSHEFHTPSTYHRVAKFFFQQLE